MKKIVIDTSSAILLYKCGLFQTVAENFSVVFPAAVFFELTVPDHDGSEIFLEYSSRHKVKVYKTINTGFQPQIKSLHHGEREVISLFLEGGFDYIIIDDGRGGAFCRDNNIPYINALLAVKILYFKKLVTEAEYLPVKNWLIANGRYSGKIIEWAEKADRKDISFFL